MTSLDFSHRRAIADARRPALMLAFVAALTLAACAPSGGGSATDTARVASATPATPPANAMAGMSDDIMLHGGCVVEAGSGGEPSIELIVDPSVAAKAGRVSIRVESVTGDELTAELSSSPQDRAMCGGMSPRILFAGNAMMLGNPTLLVKTSRPVSVLIRTSTAQPVAGPVKVAPGAAAPPLEWGGAK